MLSPAWDDPDDTRGEDTVCAGICSDPGNEPTGIRISVRAKEAIMLLLSLPSFAIPRRAAISTVAKLLSTGI